MSTCVERKKVQALVESRLKDLLKGRRETKEIRTDRRVRPFADCNAHRVPARERHGQSGARARVGLEVLLEEPAHIRPSARVVVDVGRSPQARTKRPSQAELPRHERLLRS